MAQLSNLLVTGSSRLLGKLFCNDISVGNSLSVKTLSATNFTATSITTSGLTVNGNATTTGTLNVGNSQANGKISINGKVSIRDYANNGWLGINDTRAWVNGVYFGSSTIRTDGIFQLGDAGNKVLFNASSAKFSIPVTINNSLAANNITATNVTVNGKLVAYQQEIRTIQDLGGEFCVSPTIYIQKASKTVVNVRKIDSTTISISIKDEKAITSSTIQGVKWAKGSKIKIQSKIDGIVIKGDGTMTNTLNTDQYTMSIDVVVDSSIADHFSTAKNNASFDEINIMLYQRYGKKIGSTTENAYSPVGIRMSATGSANAAPYLDIWGSKSSSDPDTVYTVPSVRLGYLGDISMTLNGSSISCNGYGLYADNVYLNGTIVSNSGTIGGFKIGTNDLSNGTWGTDKSVLMCTGTNTSKAVGGSSAISGWCFTAGSKFGVTTNGDLYASKATITGDITATSGTIGGCSITKGVLKVASGNITSVNADNITSGTLSADRIGANSVTVSKITTENLVGTNGWINLNKGTFNYGKGALVWDGSNLSMKGKIQATSGNIAGWDILELGFSKNLKQLYSGSDGTYLGLDGIRINDATYGISLNGGLLKFWKGNSFAGGIFPLGYEENKPSSLGFYITEAHSSLRFGTATASTEVLGNISAADTCYVIGDNLDSAGINYKNTFYNGVKIDRLSCNEFCNVYSSGDIDTSTDFYRKGNKLGEYFTDMVTSTTKSLANNTWTNTGAAITLSKGVYAMVGTVVYAAAKSGRRGARFANLSSGYTQTTNVTSATTASQTAYVQCQWIVVVTDDFQDYYLQGYQDTGAVLNVTSSYMRAVRIA